MLWNGHFRWEACPIVFPIQALIYALFHLEKGILHKKKERNNNTIARLPARQFHNLKSKFQTVLETFNQMLLRSTTPNKCNLSFNVKKSAFKQITAVCKGKLYRVCGLAIMAGIAVKFGTTHGRSRPAVGGAKCIGSYGRKGVPPAPCIFGTCQQKMKTPTEFLRPIYNFYYLTIHI